MKVVRVYCPPKLSNVIAFFDIEIEGFRINGFKLLRGDHANYISMPARLGKNNRWFPVAYPVTSQQKLALEQSILVALREIGTNRMVVETSGLPSSKVSNEKKEEKIEIKKIFVSEQKLYSLEGALIDEESDKESDESLLNRNIKIYSGLESGKIKPRNKCEENFVLGCKGILVEKSRHLYVYVKHKRQLYEQKKMNRKSEGISEYEEGHPTPQWFTDDDWRKLRSGDYSDMKRRGRGA